MDQTTYPGSETDNNEVLDQCDFQSTASNELDFVDRWVNLTLEKEVIHGCKLREEKLKSNPEPLECEIVNIDFNPPCLEFERDDKGSTFYRKFSPGRKKVQTFSSSPRSKSPYVDPALRCIPQTFHSRPDSPVLKAKCVPRCPLRIAELAVPTKRQCFDTWRNKSDVLPACMVERLRQQVMDEKPVIQIADAVTCFRRRRPKSSKSVNKRPNKMSRETRRKEEIRILCAAFAEKIARKLIVPQNINLTPELDKLSKVVAKEITKIIQNRKKYNFNHNTQKKIHADVADKIAVWIATILEDSSYKLLEEDLRELEEEEGPVLDLIDNLVDNALDICEPDMSPGNISETTSKAFSDVHSERSIDSPHSIENNEFNASVITYDTAEGTIIKSNEPEALDSEIETSTQATDSQLFDHNYLPRDNTISSNDYIQGQIENIVDSIPSKHDIPTFNDDMKTGNEDVLNENEPINDDKYSTKEFKPLPPAPGNSELQHINQVQSIPDLLVEDPTSNSNIVDVNVVDGNKSVQLVESEGDVFEPLAEESLDEKNKKVKFSEINMAIRRSRRKLDSTDLVEGAEKDNIVLIASTDSIKQDIMLAPRNDHLLSDADEAWPGDIAPTFLKPSASVNRSITSLGRILEKDEKLLLSDDEILSIVNLEAIRTNESSPLNGNGKGIDKNDTIKGTVESYALNRDFGKALHERSGTKTPPASGYRDSSPEGLKFVNTANLKVENDTIGQAVKPNEMRSALEGNYLDSSIKPELSREIADRSPLTTDNGQNLILQAKTEKQTEDTGLKNLESEPNFIYEAVEQKLKTSYVLPEPKFDYKVHPNTAPSWLRSDNGRGEPSEDSFYSCKPKAKFNDDEIRSWCKDLDRIYTNMGMWSEWLDATCKKVLQLKQKTEMNKLFAPHVKKKDATEWTTLKKNIDKDSVLWTKLNQRAYGRLKSYKDKVKNKICSRNARNFRQASRPSTQVMTTWRFIELKMFFFISITKWKTQRNGSQVRLLILAQFLRQWMKSIGSVCGCIERLCLPNVVSHVIGEIMQD